ncbi:hypothetical protein AMTRI_Chr12g274280 [Amborella trichopoda]
MAKPIYFPCGLLVGFLLLSSLFSTSLASPQTGLKRHSLFIIPSSSPITSQQKGPFFSLTPSVCLPKTNHKGWFFSLISSIFPSQKTNKKTESFSLIPSFSPSPKTNKKMQFSSLISPSSLTSQKTNYKTHSIDLIKPSPAPSKSTHKSRSLSATVTGQSMISQFLVPQNKIRAQVGLPPLKWSTKLANYAKWWANQRRRGCALIHSNGKYGENIFWGGGKSWGPADAVKTWASEKVYYNHQRNSCQSYEECGHYTQMVWRKSLMVGCARVICNSGDTFITCNYDPPGNYFGEQPY